MASATRVLMRAAVLAFGLSMITAGGCVVSWGGPTHKETRTTSVPVEAPGGLDVSTRNGSVSVERGSTDRIQVSATLRARTLERLAEMTVVIEEVDGVLRIRPEAPGGKWQSNEGCSIEVVVPTGAVTRGITVNTSNGKISVAAMTGKAHLDTSNGSITVEDHDGEVHAKTSNGKINLHRVGGPVVADTSNGSVTVRLREDVRGPVNLDTSNGSVTLEVGRAFAGSLRISTSNGSVDVPERAEGVRVLSKKRRSASLEFGTGQPSSVIDTSNGNVRVRVLGGAG